MTEAWDKGDAFLAAYDRVKLIASTDAQAKADALRVHIMARRMLKPLAPAEDAGTVELADFPTINRDAIDRANDFVGAAADDVLRLRLRVGRSRTDALPPGPARTDALPPGPAPSAD